MSAATADRQIGDCGTRKELRIPVAAGAKIYANTLVCRNSSGYAVPASDTAGYRLAGISKGDYENHTSTVDNSAGLGGALNVTVHRHGVYEFTAAGLTVADVGKRVYVADDQTVQIAPTNVFAGILVDLGDGSSATIARVDIEPATWQEDADEGQDLLELPVAASQNIASGNLVAYTGGGYLCNANAAVAARFAGIAMEAANNGAGLDGAINCFVARAGRHNFTATGLSVADEGKPVYVGGAATVTLTPTRMFVGILSKYSSATVAPVDIEPGVSLTGDKVRVGVAAAKTVTAGNLVGLDGDGYLVAANDATCVQQLGIAMDTQDNAAGLDGALTCTVLVKGRIALTTTGALVTDKGSPAYVNAATTVKLTTSGSALMVGVVDEYVSGTSIIVDLLGSARINAKDTIKVGVAATKTVTAGQGVCLDADGYLVAANDATAISFWGIALETKDNAGGADGALEVLVLRSGAMVLTDAGGAAAATDMGDEVWQSTNATTITQTPGVILVGTIERVLSVTSVVVMFKPLAKVGQRTDRQFSIHFGHSGNALNGKTAFADREFPQRYICLSMFADVETAPGGADTLTVALTDGTTTFDCVITGAGTHGEDKTAQVPTTATMKAAFDTDVTLTDTAALSANVKGVIICEAL